MKIAFFGDSFTTGGGDPAGKGWVGRLAESQGFTAINFGVPSETGTDILGRWRTQAEASGADRLVFSFGTNDCMLDAHKRVRVSQVDRLRNAKAIMMAARPRWPVLFVSPLPVACNAPATGRIGDTARQLGVIARANDTAYVDIFHAVVKALAWCDEALKGDGCHPGADGYELVANLVAAHPVWQDWLRG